MPKFSPCLCDVGMVTLISNQIESLWLGLCMELLKVSQFASPKSILKDQTLLLWLVIMYIQVAPVMALSSEPSIGTLF